tara:strand:+ start:171 stop:575 length:405 start_codon:yes stop_codon:yes gene_type:complete
LFKFLKKSEQELPIENSYFDAVEILILFANADGKINEDEKESIVEFIKSRFPDKNASILFNQLKVKTDASTSFNENVNELNNKLSKSEKLDLLRTIWNLILADGVIDKYEENLFYRIGDLIYIKRTELNKIKNT